MFTAEEQPLLTGTNEEIEGFVDCERCMILDWRCTEEEALDDVLRFLPDGALTYEATRSGKESISIRLQYREREALIFLPSRPQNNFRVLLRAWPLLQPDFDLKMFRCTVDSDTQGFLLRPTEWWKAYRAAYPQQYERIFCEVTDLYELWELEQPSPPEADKSPETSQAKPWWRFWE